MLSLIMVLMVLIPLVINILGNRSANRLYVALKHETVSKGTTTRHITYRHYSQFHVARVIA